MKLTSPSLSKSQKDSKSRSKQFISALNGISSQISKQVLQNNKEISSKLLTSKTKTFFNPRNFIHIPTQTLQSESNSLIPNNKLNYDKAAKLSSLTYRQDISHLLDSSQSKHAHTTRDFFKDRNFSLPFENKISLIRVKTPNLKKNQEELSTYVRHSPSKMQLDNLKKEFPSSLTSNPSGRLEVILVNEWLENSLKKIAKAKSLDESARTAKIWEVFEICFKEAERQLLFDCQERGKLLMRLWEILQDLREKDKENLSNEKENIKFHAYDDYNRLHAMYKSQIEDKQYLTNKYKEEIVVLTKACQDLRKEKNLLEQREHQMRKKLSETNLILQFVKKKLKIVTSENERLLYKSEGHINKPIKIQTKSEDSSESSEKDGASEKSIEEEFDQTLKDLNRNAITSIPEKSRSEQYKDKETMIENEFIKQFTNEVIVQTELVFMANIYEKVMVSTKACQEMAEDYYYKKEIEEEEFMKYLIEEEKRLEKHDKNSNKEELTIIKQKLKDFKEKHKNDVDEANGVALAGKMKGVLNKLKILKNLNTQDELISSNGSKNFDENDKLIKKKSSKTLKNDKDNEYETEEEEAESDTNNDEQRHNVIIKELNNNEETSQDNESIYSNSSKKAKFNEISNSPNSKASIISSLSKEKNLTYSELDRKNSKINHKFNSALLRNNKPSFQINLRKSKMESKSSSKRQKSMLSNQVFFSQAKLRSSIQKETMLEEIEKTLIEGLQEMSQENLNNSDYLKNYMRCKGEGGESLGKEKEEYLKLLLLYKTENKKAVSIAEKFKRTDEMFEMESMHRVKLEEKHKDLLKNYDSIQKELEQLKQREKEQFQETMNDEKQRKNSNPENMESSVAESLELSQKAFERKDIRKMTKQGTFKKKILPKYPKLGQKINIESKITNTGTQLLDKIKVNKMKKFANFMHIKLVLKQIHLIYLEKIGQTKENELSKQVAFPNSIYNYYLSLFGLKKIADRRFIIFLLSLQKYSSFFRIAMFARLLGLYDGKTNYNLEELNKYIEALDFCTNVSTMGTNIINPDSDSKFYIPYIRALQYTGIFADTRMTNEENAQLKQEIENLKESDSKGINKAGIIDFDLFMERMLSKYRFLVNKAKTYVINAFAACDLDGNKMCKIEEWLLLNRHIEKEKYDKKNLKKIFNKNADIDNDGEKNLSFDKFSVLCVEYNLFTDEAQNKYLQITKKSQLEVKMEEVRDNWYAKKFQLIESFDNLNIISKEEIESWIKIIIVLEERIMGNNEENKQIKPTLIAYNILVQENELLKLKQEKKENGIFDIDEEEEDEEEMEENIENFINKVESERRIDEKMSEEDVDDIE